MGSQKSVLSYARLVRRSKQRILHFAVLQYRTKQKDRQNMRATARMEAWENKSSWPRHANCYVVIDRSTCMPLNKLLQWDGHLLFHCARGVHVSGDVEKLCSRIPLATQAHKPWTTTAANSRRHRYGFYVGDSRRATKHTWWEKNASHLLTVSCLMYLHTYPTSNINSKHILETIEQDLHYYCKWLCRIILSF